MDYLKQIVPADALGITVSKHWKNGIELSAPLSGNVNDKGTGFAGSISSLLMLAGWTLITRELQQAGIAADVMVVKSEIDFTAAVTADLCAVCEVSEKDITRLFAELKTRGRNRIELQSEIPDCARMSASFAVICKS